MCDDIGKYPRCNPNHQRLRRHIVSTPIRRKAQADECMDHVCGMGGSLCMLTGRAHVTHFALLPILYIRETTGIDPQIGAIGRTRRTRRPQRTLPSAILTRSEMTPTTAAFTQAANCCAGQGVNCDFASQRQPGQSHVPCYWREAHFRISHGCCPKFTDRHANQEWGSPPN